jgi:hypothetical protein
MSTPPSWPLPGPERPNPFAPPPDHSKDAGAGQQSSYGPGYAPPTWPEHADAPPWLTPPPAQPEPVPSPYGYGPNPGYTYGYGPNPGYAYPPPVWANPQPPMDGLAIASLVTSCAALAVGISAPVGIGLGIASLRKIRRTGARGRGLAWAGIAVGSVITLLIAGVILLGFALAGFSDSTNGNDNAPWNAAGGAPDASTNLALEGP